MHKPLGGGNKRGGLVFERHVYHSLLKLLTYINYVWLSVVFAIEKSRVRFLAATTLRVAKIQAFKIRPNSAVRPSGSVVS